MKKTEKKTRTLEDVNNDYTQSCALLGHKTQQLKYLEKQIKTTQYECEELLKSGQAFNKEAEKLREKTVTPITEPTEEVTPQETVSA